MLSIFEMSKRYVVAALVGLIGSALTAMGIVEVMDPETLEQVTMFAASFVTFIFYVITIISKSILQKRAINNGKVLQERIESKAVARDNML